MKSKISASNSGILLLGVGVKGSPSLNALISLLDKGIFDKFIIFSDIPSTGFCNWKTCFLNGVEL